MITIKKTTSNTPSYHFYFNSVYLGDAIMDESGFYSFWFAKDSDGCWASYSLRWIADKLDELNQEWGDYINENLKNE